VKRILIDTASIERHYLALNRAAAEELLRAQGWGVALTADSFIVTHWRRCVLLERYSHLPHIFVAMVVGNARLWEKYILKIRDRRFSSQEILRSGSGGSF
jgi:hypothetical protein